jgi:membrane associated rhomboid family serine protease/Zn-finger nucleic acid-binding protein
MTQCPRCATPLEEHRTPVGFIYGCATCGGQNAAFPVLRKAGASERYLRLIWGAAMRPNAPHSARCPHCRRPMSRVPTRVGSDRLELDVCTHCRSIWFDAREIDALPHETSVAPVSEAPTDDAAALLAMAESLAQNRQPAAARQPATVRQASTVRQPAVPRAPATPRGAPGPAASVGAPPDQGADLRLAPASAKPGARPSAPGEGLSAEARQRLAVMEVQADARKEAEDTWSASAPPEQWWQWLPGLLGMPVEQDEQAFDRLPLLTWSISAALVVVFFATVWNLEAVADAWGFIPADMWRQDGMTWVTSFFLHAGIFHLIANVYFFMVFGDNVEDNLGPVAFVLLLAASHAAGMLAHAQYAPQLNIPCVGASAGISGVLAYYAVAFPRARVGILFRIFVVMRWIRVPAWGMLVLFIIAQIIGAAVGGDSIAYFAHLGGLTVGLAAAVAVRLTRPPQPGA